MHIPTPMLAGWIVVACSVLAVVALAVAALRADWKAVLAAPQRMHLIAGGSVICLLLWLLNMHGGDGLVLHFLGVTTLTLVVGWPFAVLAGSLALCAFYAFQDLAWSGIGTSMVSTVLVPATLSRWLAHRLQKTGIRHPFVYFLGAGFAGGALVVLVLGLGAALLFWLSGMTEYLETMAALWPMIVLIMFSEGFLNGMCVSALAVFYPDWMKTFDDRFYLDGP